MKPTFPSLSSWINQATQNRESLNISCTTHASILLPNENIRDLMQQDGWTQDGRMTKKCRARLCTPIVTRHFSTCCSPDNLVPRVLSLLRESRERTLGTRLQSWVFQPSCCVRSLLIWLHLIWVRFGRQCVCVSRWPMQNYVVVKSKWSTWLGRSGRCPSHELLIIDEIGRQKEKKWEKTRWIKQWKEYIYNFVQ